MFKDLLLVFFGLLISLLLGEAALRIFHPQEELNLAEENVFFVEHDGELGWVNKKGAEGDWRPNPSEPAARVRINGLGMRGGGALAEKAGGVRRVLVIGDSVTFGYGVKEEDAYPERLGGLLPPGYEALNAGVVGYGTDQELLYMRREGLSLKPDMVVVGFTPGDVQDNTSSLILNYHKPYFRLTEKGLAVGGVPVPEKVLVGKSVFRDQKLKIFLYVRSHLYRLLINRLYLGLKVGKIEETSRQDGIGLTAALLKELQGECSKNNIPMRVLLLPNGIWLGMSAKTGERAGFYGMLVGMLEQGGISVIDPYGPLLAESKAGKELFLKGDPVHLNAEGHKVVAGELYKALKEDVLDR